MRIIIIICILVLITACSSQQQNSNSGVALAFPSPQPTASKEESEKTEKAETEQKQKVVRDFVTQNYKGWKLEGEASDSYSDICEENSLCDLHLVSGAQSKVITVILKQFHKTDGASYWFVREATQLDLAKIKIESIKDREKESVLENLTDDEVKESVRESIIDQWKETENAQQEQQDYEPPDPEG